MSSLHCCYCCYTSDCFLSLRLFSRKQILSDPFENGEQSFFPSCLLLFPAFGTFRRLLFRYVFMVKFHPFKASFPPSHPHPGAEPALTGSGVQQQFLGGLGPTRCPQATGQSLTTVGDLQTLQRREAQVPPPADQDFSLPTVLPALKMDKNRTVSHAGPTCRPSTSTMRRVGLE